MFAVVLGAALSLGACSSNNTAPAVPAKPGTTLQYAAIGASDAVGVGASVPCSSTSNPTTCPGGTGYVPDLTRMLDSSGYNVALDDLGISGAVLGPDIRSMGDMYGSIGASDQCMPRTGSDVIPGDFITNELPSVSASSNLITIFAGGNDTDAIVNALGCGAGGNSASSQSAFITTWITNFGNDYQSLYASLKSTAPGAKIVVANLPNFALIPRGQSEPGDVQQALQAVSVGMDVEVINKFAAAGVPVVDLLCNANSYVPANFSSDGFHPDDAGYLQFAQLFQAQILTTSPAPPASSCSYMSGAASAFRVRLRQPVTHSIAPFDVARRMH